MSAIPCFAWRKTTMTDRAENLNLKRTTIHRQVIELGARWYVFIFLNLYGLAKLVGAQFYRPGKIPEDVSQTLLGEATGFDLAWTFMGHSLAYMAFIGLAEVVGAWLLLWERTKLIGVAILLPVMLNVIVFDIIFLNTYGALASATIYTILLVVILACNKAKVAQAVGALMSTIPSKRIPRRVKARRILVVLLSMAVLFAFDQFMVNLLGHGKG
ncbi:MAG: hypothetical protein ACI97A_004228 [Planctomycetota bacterium]|jgi:hypothetical protein